MAKRFIDTEIWDKEKFCSSSDKQKLLTLFITSKCDQIGVFKMANMLITAYVGSPVTKEDILSIPVDIIELSEGKYWLVNFCKFQYGELKETCKPHKKYIEMLKSEGLFERVSKGYPKGIHTLQEKEKEKEEEKEKDKDKKKETKKFTPPQLHEVSQYCIDRKNSVDASKFIDFYECKGWMVGKNKMKCWKSAVRTWEKSSSSNQQPQQTSGYQSSQLL